MSQTSQIAKHFRDVHLGGNWTAINLKDQLSDLTYKEAMIEVEGLNSIAKLAYHIQYYYLGAIKVLEGGSLDIKDKFSFDLPEIKDQSEWDAFLAEMWNSVEKFAKLVEQIPDDKMGEHFEDKKYGNYFRNLHGIIEHSHYHLGQIVVQKKMLRTGH